jgi:hypothetical protein
VGSSAEQQLLAHGQAVPGDIDSRFPLWHGRVVGETRLWLRETEDEKKQEKQEEEEAEQKGGGGEKKEAKEGMVSSSPSSSSTPQKKKTRSRTMSRDCTDFADAKDGGGAAATPSAGSPNGTPTHVGGGANPSAEKGAGEKGEKRRGGGKRRSRKRKGSRGGGGGGAPGGEGGEGGGGEGGGGERKKEGSPTVLAICRHFGTAKGCRFGNLCRFRHINEGEGGGGGGGQEAPTGIAKGGGSGGTGTPAATDTTASTASTATTATTATTAAAAATTAAVGVAGTGVDTGAAAAVAVLRRGVRPRTSIYQLVIYSAAKYVH